MRIAVCLSGQARAIDTNFSSIYNNLISPAGADVFCHFWDSGVGGRDRALHAIEKFKPVKWQVQEQIDFNQYPGKGNTPLTRSQFYSVKRCNNLRRLYEAEHNFSYDLVVRSRTDLIIENRFDVGFYSQDLAAIYALSRGDEKVVDQEFILHEHWPGMSWQSSWKWRDDMFLVANSKNMDLYCMAYDEIDELVHLLKGKTYKDWSSGQEQELVGPSIPGETAMIYNQRKNLMHVRAFISPTTRAWRMSPKEAP